MEIFAVLNVDEAPKRLKWSNDGNEFYFYFPPPLPSTIVLFIISKDARVKDTFEVSIFIDNTVEEKYIGEIGSEKPSLHWNGTWSSDEIVSAEKIQSSGRLLKLSVLKQENNMDEDFSSQDPQKINMQNKNSSFTESEEIEEFDNKLQDFDQELEDNQDLIKKLHKKVIEKNTGPNIKDFFRRVSKDSEVAKSKPKNICQKEMKSNNKENLKNYKKKEEFDPFELPTDDDTSEEMKVKKTPVTTYPGKRNSPFASPPGKPKKPCLVRTPETNSKLSRILKSPKSACNRSPSTPTFSDVLHKDSPSPRWGHAFSYIRDEKAIVLGGQGTNHQMNADSLWTLDTLTNKWQNEQTDNTSVERRMGHSVCYDEKLQVLYVFGGSKHKKWYNDMYMLDIDSWKWTKVETIGKAPTRAYHSCTSFYDELLIFGGVYPNPDPTPDGCSNELIIFDKENKSWYTPIVNGDVPLPRSGHSAFLLDGKLHIFGGWDAPDCYNDMFCLDLGIMNFVQTECTGPTPSPRTWQSTCVLTDRKRVCIYGGYNGDKALNDVFLFNSITNCWTQILELDLLRRAGHGVILKTCDDDEKDRLIIFGGGDNEETFFNELLEIPINS